MEVGERPHRSGSSSSELFICFTSRSSSSMKISSKSILSPGRTDKLRDGASVSTLPSSLSRRLRSNGSMKGGQSSPMFPTGSKKKGCAFDNPEPSSPKVTCIGQVRVKTKKQGKKMRTRSRRRSGSGDGSFRKMEQTHEGERQIPQQERLPSRNGRWVHLPLSICEAVRAFGAEFNCFVPCGGRSLCSSSHEGTEREKGQKQPAGTTTTSTCGAAFARWLMALQESEEGKRREVVQGGVGSVGEEENDKAKKEGREGDEKAKVEIEEDEEDASICVPPKNALLLMRSRSEPFRMASLANRFWDSPAQTEYRSVDRNTGEDDEEEEEDEEDPDEQQPLGEEARQEEAETFEEATEDDLGELLPHVEVVAAAEVEIPETEVHDEVREQKAEEEILEIDSSAGTLEEQENSPAETELPMPEKEEEEIEAATQKTEQEEEIEAATQKTEQEEEGAKVHFLEEQGTENQFQSTDEEKESQLPDQEEEEEEEEKGTHSSQGHENEIQVQVLEVEEMEAIETQLQKHEEEAKESEVQPTAEEEEEEEKEENNVEEQRAEETSRSSCSSAVSVRPAKEEEDEEVLAVSKKQQDKKPEEVATATAAAAVEKEMVEGKEEQKREKSVQLPECLLLMMCEPKLSMEVSRETWVCSTDFLRCRPDRRPGPGPAPAESGKRKGTATASTAPPDESKRTSTDSNPAHPPPCNPTQPQPPLSMAMALEQKLVKAVAYEPFVLTRCKSEPVRSSARLAPEACFWKSRKQLPPPHQPPLGIGAAGLGF